MTNTNTPKVGDKVVSLYLISFNFEYGKVI